MQKGGRVMPGGECTCVPWIAGQPPPWSWCGVDIKKIVEINTWEREGHAPDTSKPPDTHTIEEEDFTPWIEPSELCAESCMSERHCPSGFYKLVLEAVPLPDISKCSVAWDNGYSVDPEIPHTKTYYAKETKTTWVQKAAKQAYTCIDANQLQALLDGLKHVPA
jgi:hypothetical protein